MSLHRHDQEGEDIPVMSVTKEVLLRFELLIGCDNNVEAPKTARLAEPDAIRVGSCAKQQNTTRNSELEATRTGAKASTMKADNAKRRTPSPELRHPRAQYRERAHHLQRRRMYSKNYARRLAVRVPNEDLRIPK